VLAHAPRQPGSWLTWDVGQKMNFFAKIRSRFTREPVVHEVRLDDNGFVVVLKEEVKGRVLWASVVEIYAFKRDFFAIDEICLGFRCDETGFDEWAGEEDIGYAALQKEVERRFSGIRTDWFQEVAVPAFQMNRTTLWGVPFIEKQK
jgi:hypothetical protein